ncbi:hypothetical protein D917_09440, partial [Trichinella nativa]
RLPGFVRTEQLRAHWCRYHCILCRLTFFVNEQHVPHEILMPNDMLGFGKKKKIAVLISST